MIETNEAPINQSITSGGGRARRRMSGSDGWPISAKDQLAGGAGAGCDRWRGSAAERRFGLSSCQVGFTYCYWFQLLKKFKPDKTHYFL
jgi:hypothetical protein